MTNQTITISIDGQKRSFPVHTRTDEDERAHAVLSFATCYEVLEAWQNHDSGHRKFGWTSDADDTEPDRTFVVWVDQNGFLQIEYLDPFFDGVSTWNEYSTRELTRLPTIEIVDDHP